MSIVRYNSAIDEVQIHPIPRPLSGSPILYCHSIGSSPIEIAGSSPYAMQRALWRAVEQSGCLTLGMDLQQTWSSEPERVDAAIAKLGGFGFTDKASLVGQSHGGMMALAYTLDNPDKISNTSLFLPGIDLLHLYNYGNTTITNTIAASYGPPPWPVGTNPRDRIGELQVPVHMWIHSDDELTGTSWAEWESAQPDLVTIHNMGLAGGAAPHHNWLPSDFNFIDEMVSSILPI